MPYRLAIFETHPIQYKVPWFRALARHPDLDLTVFYCLIPDARQQGKGFGVDFQWDVPLLDGYRYVVLKNVAKEPGVTHFLGCDTPSVYELIAGRWPTEYAKESATRESADYKTADGRTTDHPPSTSAAPPSSVALQAARFDAVIINGWVVKSCVQALWACRRAGVPAILRCEANDLRPRVWWKTLIHRTLLRLFSGFIAIGASNRQFYVKRGMPAARIVDGFYCVENERFARSCPRNTRATLRRGWGIPEDAVCLLFCGKFEPKKRPLDVLRALARLRADGGAAPGEERRAARARQARWVAAISGDSGPQVSAFVPPPGLHALMVGDGELRAECEAYVQEHRLPVTFAGFLNQSEMPKAYAVADCLVLPSDHGETWGLVVNEAMACGLPALVSDRVGCHPDLVCVGETGYVFPFGDVGALADRLRELATAPERLRALGERARERIRRYSIEALVEGTLAALRQVTRSSCRGGAFKA
jgi:glycosyltransferase involved in cell wall biosynthesis